MAHDHPSFALPVPMKDSAPKRRSEWRALGMLVPYMWEFRVRVALALAFLTTAKLANVGVPLVLKEVVDSLDAQTAVLVLPLALLAAYGILRFSTTLFAELRDVVFVRVTQRAIRRVALTVFRHMHSLSLRFHLERQTGGVSRDIERGTRGISTLLSYMLFSIVPVILEFSLVAVILLTRFDWRFAAVTFVAVALYISFSVAITEWHGNPPPRERTGFEGQHARDRQPAQLRDGEILQQRGIRGAPVRREPAEVRVGGREERGLARVPQHRAELHHRRRGDAAHDPRGRGRGREDPDARRSGARERPLDPALHPAQFPGHGVPRDQAGARRHGPHVPSAHPGPGDTGPAGCGAAAS